MEAKVYGVGVTTADPEIRKLGERQTSFCSANLAFNRRFKSGEEWKEEACFIQAKLWGNQADRFAEQCKKGTPVFVEGYLVQEQWESKDGVKHNVLTLKVNAFSACEKNGASNKSVPVVAKSAPSKNKPVAQPVKPKAKPQPQPEPDDEEEAVAVVEVDTDEIPF